MHALLLLAALSAAHAADSVDLPALPVRVSLSGSGSVCGSDALLNGLRYRFLRVNDGSPYDLTIACSEDSSGVVLEVRDPGGRGVAITVDRSENVGVGALAYVAAANAAKDPKVIELALKAYIAHNAETAAAGYDDFARQDWQQAVDHLNTGLESELETAPALFGLYRASAALGKPRAAKWYLEAFLKASGRKPDGLTDEQAAPLRAARASAAETDDDAASVLAQYGDLVSRHQWHNALNSLHQLVARAPWYEPAYRSLAETYRKLGWKPLAKIWKARAELVAKTNRDEKLGKKVEDRVAALDR